MYAKLFHIYGPFFIHSYGVCIALGLAVFGWLLHKDPRRPSLCTSAQLYNMLLVASVVALLGGRLLYLALSWHTLTSWYDVCAFWDGGLALLGSVWALIGCAPFYFYHQKLPALAILDLCATYVPLLQSISRIGCFLAGCCHGACTAGWLSVTYTDIHSMAPLHIPLHPVQLYSSVLLLLLFLLLYTTRAYSSPYVGKISSMYVFLSSLERCCMELFRDVPVSQSYYLYLTLNQLLALGTGLAALGGWGFFYYKRHTTPKVSMHHDSL